MAAKHAPDVAEGVGGVGRLGTVAAWVSAVCCLPYLIFKVAWTFDVPLGVADRSVLDESGWAAANAAMGTLELAGLVFVLALTRPWARRVPAWLVLFPVWVGTGLLFQLTAGVLLGTVFSTGSGASGDTDYGGFEPWVFTVVYASFAVQGIALAIAFACYVRTRWGPLLRTPTGTALATGTIDPPSWPRRHLAGLATLGAALAVTAAVACGYWAAGGTAGLPHAQEPSAAMQAARVAGALVAAAGLLALAGRWGRDRPLWLPVALLWLGSGALVAFDGLGLLANHLLLSADTAGPGWSPHDTVIAMKAVVGLLAAALGVLAVTATAGRPSGRAREESSSVARAPVVGARR